MFHNGGQLHPRQDGKDRRRVECKPETIEKIVSAHIARPESHLIQGSWDELILSIWLEQKFDFVSGKDLY